MSAIFSLFTLRQYALGAILVCIAVLDPFGLTSSSDDASARWLNRVFASFYPDTGQQQIAVILIDDAYLTRNNTHWPLPYDEQSRLFRQLLSYKPRAVFVDLLYSHDHSAGAQEHSSQFLTNVFARYQHQGIPLLVANTGQVAGDAAEANTQAEFATTSTPALVSWSGTSQYPLAMDTPLGPMETPAMGLYRQYCKHSRCPTLPNDTIAATAAPAIAVQWGTTQSPQQLEVAKLSACSASAGTWGHALSELFHGLAGKADEQAKGRCPYSLTLTASDLEVNDPEDREVLARLLHDRLVLVGANITSASDLTQSPVHGKIPGVYLHAMALDNLLTRGMSYDREPGALPILGLNWLDLFELLLLAAIAVLKKLVSDVQPKAAASHWVHSLQGWCRAHTVAVWALFMAGLALFSWGVYGCHFTPVNVLGIATLSLVLFSEKIDTFFSKGQHTSPATTSTGTQG